MTTTIIRNSTTTSKLGNLDSQPSRVSLITDNELGSIGSYTWESKDDYAQLCNKD
jgi:hypothetical protein